MKKIFAISAILLVALLLVLSFSLVFANAGEQRVSQVTPVPGGPGWMWNNQDGEYSHGPGMMWDNDGEFSGGMWGNHGAVEDNPMHDVMIEYLAEAADLTVDTFNARLGEGETMYQILESTGLSAEEITEVYNNAHDAALQAAIDEGWMTQEQADWMDGRMQGMWGGGSGFRGGGCGGNMRGSYQGSNL